MDIPSDYLERLRANVPLVDLVRKTVLLREDGSALRGSCPDHQDAVDSLHVDAARQIYHCYGCGDGGDVIRWTMRRMRLNKGEAVRQLAESVGLPPPDGC